MLLDSIVKFHQEHGNNRCYWIAYSGGMDSHVLLALFAQLRLEHSAQVRAIHVNHGISENATKWSHHCAQVCRDYGIDYFERTIQIETTTGQSIEDIARKKRYDVFAEHLNVGDILLTAHHQDDQAETVLLQLLRGSGLKGLAAMPVMKVFANGLHARPLLGFARAELEQFALTHKLNWIEDESNDNVKLSRNFIRHNILPLLKTRWKTATKTISRSAMHCAEAQVLLEEMVANNCKQVQGSKPQTLSIQQLLRCDLHLQKLILRTWIHQLGHPLPDVKKLTSICKDVLSARKDRVPCVQWANSEVRRYRDDLYVMQTLSQHNAAQSYPWNVKNELFIAGLGLLKAVEMPGKGMRLAGKEMHVCFRRNGENVYLPGRGKKRLKHLFQEWAIPPWKRNRIPLILLDDVILAIVGYYSNPEWLVKEDEKGFEIFMDG